MIPDFNNIMKDEQKREKLRRQLLLLYSSGKSMPEASKAVNLTAYHGLKVLSFNKKEFEQAKVDNRNSRAKQSYIEFIEITKAAGIIPTLEEYKKIKGSIPGFYPENKRKAIEAGYPFTKEKEAAWLSYDKEDMLNHLRELAKTLNHTPFGDDVDAAGKYKKIDYGFVFGKYTAAIAQAGLEPNIRKANINPQNPIDWEKEAKECYDELKSLYIKLGRRPGEKDIANLTTRPYHRFFIAIGSTNFDKLTLSDTDKIWWDAFKMKHPNWKRRGTAAEDKKNWDK